MPWEVVAHYAGLQRLPYEVHVMPVFPGERKHQATDGCWCEPEPDPEEVRTTVHKRVVWEPRAT